MNQKNKYLAEFLELKSTDLLKRRALGPELSEEAHEAIEAIMSDRREEVPPRPKKALNIKADGARRGLSRSDYIVLAIAAFLLCGAWMKGERIYYGQIFGPVIAYVLYRKFFSSGGLTSLMVAASEGDVIKARYLLGCRSVNVNAVSPDGATALMFAAKNGDSDMVRTLIAAGADLKIATPKGATACMLAARTGNLDMLRVLMTAGANPAVSTKTGESALSIAQGRGDEELMKVLQFGAHVHLENQVNNFLDAWWDWSGGATGSVAENWMRGKRSALKNFIMNYVRVHGCMPSGVIEFSYWGSKKEAIDMDLILRNVALSGPSKMRDS